MQGASRRGVDNTGRCPKSLMHRHSSYIGQIIPVSTRHATIDDVVFIYWQTRFPGAAS